MLIGDEPAAVTVDASAPGVSGVVAASTAAAVELAAAHTAAFCFNERILAADAAECSCTTRVVDHVFIDSWSLEHTAHFFELVLIVSNAKVLWIPLFYFSCLVLSFVVVVGSCLDGMFFF